MATCWVCAAVGSTFMMRQRQLHTPSSWPCAEALQLTVHTGCGTVKQQSPSTLDVLHQRYPFQEGPVGFQHIPEMGRHEVLVSQRCAQHLDALFYSWQIRPSPHRCRLPAASAICWRTSQTRGRIPPAFHTLILPKCTRMFASRLMHSWTTANMAPMRSGTVTTCRSSRNANNRSPSLIDTNALCWPNANRRGMRGSAHQPSHDVACHDPSDPTVRFRQRNHPPHSDGIDHDVGNLNSGQLLTHPEQQMNVVRLRQQRAEMLPNKTND